MNYLRLHFLVDLFIFGLRKGSEPNGELCTMLAKGFASRGFNNATFDHVFLQQSTCVYEPRRGALVAVLEKVWQQEGEVRGAGINSVMRQKGGETRKGKFDKINLYSGWTDG